MRKPSVRRFGAVTRAAVVAAAASVMMTTLSGSAIAPSAMQLANEFRLTLHLDETRVPAGTPITGYILAINATGQPIEIPNARCDTWVQAGLSGPHIRFGVFSLLIACRGIELDAGVTRIPTTIETTYTQCAQGKQKGTIDFPHCPRGPRAGTMPPLPPGRYQALVGTLLPTQPDLPAPITVTVTANR